MLKDVIFIETREPEKKIERRLTIGEKFEEGGMSMLMEAIDTNLMRKVAMKILKDAKTKDEYELSRMVMEAQVTAQLDHPNIVPIYELGIDKKKRLFFTMKKIQGKALYELIKEKELKSRSEKDIFRLVRIMLKVCDAVSYAHSKGVLHRDLKPDNIMVGTYGQVYLMDWGIAYIKDGENQADPGFELPGLKKRKKYNIREEQKGNVFGTPCYMSPEQAHGDINAVDERSDIFSLGAILYEILTGEFPVGGNTLQEMLINARDYNLKPPDERVDFPLPVGLVKITMKAMSKNPEDRHQSVEELRDELENFLEGSERFPGRKYHAGQLIVGEGDRGDEAFIIKAGECRVFKTINGEEVDIRVLKKGEVFGETAILTDNLRTASVEAVTDVTVAVINRSYFEEELDAGTWLGPFIKALAQRFLEADQKLNS